MPPQKILVSWPVPIDLAPLKRAMPNAAIAYCSLTDENVYEAAADVDIWIAGGPPVTPQHLDAAKKLKWLQLFGAGLPPGIFGRKYAQRGITLTNASGVNVVNLAEHVVMFILAFARGLPTFMERQRAQKFVPAVEAPPLFEASGKTLGILGYGPIGRALAERARALGMTVWAMRRSPSEQDFSEVHKMFTPETMKEHLAACDHVAVTLPLNEATMNIMNCDTIAAMKPGAYLYNIGRGKTVDTDALVAALASGHLAGAGLDVTAPEPLPKGHPLWTMPNVMLTGHTAGNTPDFFPRTLAFIAENMRRYASGQPLMCEVPLDNAALN